MVARGASARVRLVGHLGWVHQHEACPVGQPRELMMPHREARMPAEIGVLLVGKDVAGGVKYGTLDVLSGENLCELAAP